MKFMMQPAVTLTDYALACEGLTFAYLLKPARSRPVVFAAIVFFVSIAVASALGGTVHGYFDDPTTKVNRVLWNLTLVTIGITAFAGTRSAALLRFREPVVLVITRTAAVVFVTYCIVVLFVSNRFLVAILNYLPVVLFLGWAFLTAYRESRQPPLLFGFAGICVLLAAAGLQQAKIGIHPTFFDYNALYHVLQGLGLLMIFLPWRNAGRCMEVEPA
jgi:hypothetical protein